MSAATPAPVPIPEELAAVPAGALLAGLLDDIDVSQVSGYDTVEVLCAHYRQLCRQVASFYRAVLETGLRRPFSMDTVERVKKPGEFAAEEARAALVWSRARAERVFGFAIDVFCRLPVLGEAMFAGQLDEPRARAFVEWTEGLTDAQAETVCDQLLAEAPGLMVGELIDRIKRACLAIDPDWAEKRYREAVRTRRVRGSRNPDGTANLGGYSQPLDRVAAASERIDTLAKRCKRAGDRRLIDHIRSDLFLGMTDGTFEGMSEDEIVAHVFAHPYTDPTDKPDGDELGGDTPGSDTQRPDGGPGGDGGQPRDDVRPQGGGSNGVTGALGGARDSSNQAAVRGVGRGVTARSWAVPEVRVELATLLGASEHPAEISPWGYVSGDHARRLVAGMRSAEWRYVFCDLTASRSAVA